MNVAAPRTLSTGIEAALAATSNAPVSKSAGSAPPSATGAAFFPDLLGQMVDSEIENQPSSRREAPPGSKATAMVTVRASGKLAGERKQTVSAATTSATAAESGQNPVTPDLASARTHYPWLPQDGALFLTAASSGPFSETLDTSGDGTARKASPTLVGANGEAASGQGHATRATAKLGQALADATSPPAGGEQASKPVTESAGESVTQPSELALGASANAAAAQQALALSGPHAVAGSVPGATDGAGARVARCEPATAVSSSQAIASSPSTAAAIAPPDGRMSTAGWQATAANQNIAKTQAASTAAEGVDAATSVFARLAAPSADRTFEPDRRAIDPSDANAADGAGASDGDSLAEQGTLAFQALLVPAPAAGPQRPGQGSREAGDDSGGRQPALEASGGLSGGHSGFRSARDADPGLASAVRPGPAGGAPQAELAANGLSMVAPVSSNAGVGAAAPPQGTHPQHAAAPAPSDLSLWDAAGPAPKLAAGGPAREIQLELRDADARVNVRLIERAGSIQVDVRTPDSHLAASLRDDLPALTARLEQTGLRAETWHDAPAAAAARIRMAEPVSSAGFQSSQNQSRREGGGGNPRDGQPQEKRQHQNQPDPKEFSWLYTSLQ